MSRSAKGGRRGFPVRRVLFLLFLLGAVGAVGVHYSWPEVVPVRTFEVARGRVEAIVANTRAGTIRAPRRARLSPSAMGQVARLAVQEGDRVEAGAELLELWNDDLAAQVRLAESRVAASRARADEVCLLADQARREAERQQRLSGDGIASDDVVEKAVADSDARQAACRAARAALAESEASVAVARAALEKTKLVAPFAGVVAEVDVELGEYVTPSPPGIPMPPAIDLIEEGTLYVVAPIDEVDAPQVRPGLPARVRVDAFPGRSFEGRVRRVAPYALDREKQARTVDVEVDLLKTPGEGTVLLPGYSADVEVIVEVKADVLRVPSEAIIDGDQVLLFAPEGKLARREIRPGLANWEYTEVLGGLDVEDRIVTSLDRDGAEAGAVARDEGPEPARPEGGDGETSP